MPEYVIHLHRINRELDRSQELIREHCQHLNRLADHGCLIAAGPCEDGAGGIIIGRFDSECDAIHFANSDPFVLGGDCRADVREWHWSRPENGHLGALPPRPGSWPGFLDTLHLRVTVRCFARETLSEQTVRTLIEAAITAPSEFNLQPWRPVICRTSDERNRLMQCCFNQPHVASAALAVICAVDPKVFYDDAPRAVDESIAAGRLDASERNEQIDFIRSCYRDPKKVSISAIRNGTIFGHHLLISALSMGYASFWLGGFDEKKLKRTYSLPDSYFIAGIIGIGRAAEYTAPQPRRSFEEIVHGGQEADTLSNQDHSEQKAP